MPEVTGSSPVSSTKKSPPEHVRPADVAERDETAASFQYGRKVPRMTAARQHILVVDDEAIIPEMISFFLGKTYEIRVATTGAEALARVRRDRVDLVVLDHRLPDRTGLDVLIELRSIQPLLPVIMLTGYGSEWICASAFKRGVTDYLQKPMTAAELVAAVQRVLSPRVDRAGSIGESGPISKSQISTDLPAPPCLPIQRAIGVIQQRYWDRLSLSALARQVGMSKYRLSHRFRAVLGITFREYLLTVRLERAKALLAAGHVSITEVAHDVGFGDLARFDKVFKRYTGFTPSAYRSSSRLATSTKDPATNY
jgi:two-component system response regulator YesN